jgi:hypothetical protein
MAEKKTKLADNKTKPTTASVEEFLNCIDNEQNLEDRFVLPEMNNQKCDDRALCL